MSDHDELETGSLLLIVVGADLRAEISDRPLAYRLREQILRWQDEHDEAEADGIAESAGLAGNLGHRLEPLVCSDLWYLNNPGLMARPTIAVGDPAVNAATAYLAPKLATALVIEQVFRVHLDLEYIELQACLWGVNPSATASAIDLFAERYLDVFLSEAQGFAHG